MLYFIWEYCCPIQNQDLLNHTDAERRYCIGKQQSLPAGMTPMLIPHDSSFPHHPQQPLPVGCVVDP